MRAIRRRMVPIGSNLLSVWADGPIQCAVAFGVSRCILHCSSGKPSEELLKTDERWLLMLHDTLHAPSTSLPSATNGAARIRFSSYQLAGSVFK